MLNRALKVTRQFHDISQSDLADRLDVSKGYLSELEAGKKVPTVDFLNSFAAHFKMPASTLLLLAERLSGADEKQSAKAIGKVMKFLEWVVDEEKNNDAERPRKTA